MATSSDPPQQGSHQSLYVGNLVLHISVGSLFHLPVDCIVNSENNRFRLARPGGNSVSSQLAEKYNPNLQAHLAEETGGVEQPPGTVIESPGYGNYDQIYHAGHQPYHVWTAEALTDEERANHFRVVRKCIADILHRFGESDSESIGFPLIGCGSFDLDPWLFGHEFMHELLEQSSDPKFSGKHVWLVVFEKDLFPDVLNAATQALADRANQGRHWDPLNLGVRYIDQFEEAAFGNNHPRWIAWLLVRYAELVTGHLLYLLASAQGIPPQEILDPNRPVCFGVLRQNAYRMAREQRTSSSDPAPWIDDLAETVYSFGSSLQKLNEDRNHIAHGRDPRSIKDMREDVSALVEELREFFKGGYSSPSSDDLIPWTCVTDDNDVGVLDRWREGSEWRYLLPAERKLVEVSVSQ